MKDMESGDEFAEFDTTEDEIDAMMAAGEPVEVEVPGEARSHIDSLYVVMGASLSVGGFSVTRSLAVNSPLVTTVSGHPLAGTAA